MDCSVDVKPPSDGDAAAEAKLRERRPTATNSDELLGLMEVKRTVRRTWISKESANITDILTRYPRQADMPMAVHALCCWPIAQQALTGLACFVKKIDFGAI